MRDITRSLASITTLSRTVADDASGPDQLSASEITEILTALKATVQICQKAIRAYQRRCSHKDEDGQSTVVFERDPVDSTASGWICFACTAEVGHRNMSAEEIAETVNRSDP